MSEYQVGSFYLDAYGNLWKRAPDSEFPWESMDSRDRPGRVVRDYVPMRPLERLYRESELCNQK